MHELDADFNHPSYWHVFASEREWRPGIFDPLVRLIADDVVANVMIVAPDCGWLLHPYDGGMDVIAESQAERDRRLQLTAPRRRFLGSLEPPEVAVVAERCRYADCRQ